jgi:16S rRNA (cytidine1402-2'-O)-methyltransferase
MGTLYIVPTPIGNLEDMTLRALRVLREVSLIAAEDTRTTQVLLRHYEITTPLTSYHEHNKLSKLDRIFAALAAGDVALVSDAGTPGISDPGYELVQAAIAGGWRVEALPGPSALLPALVASGLPADQFVYLGFLPRKTQARRAVLESLRTEPRTVIAYESPNRLLGTLAELDSLLPERPLCVAREISKIYEEYVRGTALEVHAHFEAQAPRGEIVLLIGGAAADESAWDETRVEAALDALLAEGESLSRAAKTVAAQSGWQRRAVYALKTNPGKSSQNP